MFFLGLFVLVFGIQKAGLIDMMAEALLSGDRRRFQRHRARDPVGVGGPVGVHRQHPVRRDDDPADQGDGADLRRRRGALLPLWWALSLGACLGGNGTLIGASANLVVAGLAERAGTTFRFVEYLKVAFPLMLISIVLSHVYLYFRFL